MSRKLATTIKDSAIPGKYKRVLEAYAAFANNDGTNIYPAKGKLAAKAGAASPDTIYRNTPDLLASGILSVAESHTCRVEACNKGSHHYTGHQGKYTTAYNLHIGNLQNAERYLSAKCLKVNAAKCRKVLAAKCGTDSGIKETPAPLGINPNSSALTSGKEENKEPLASLAEGADIQEQEKPSKTSELESEEQNQPQLHPSVWSLDRLWYERTERRFTDEEKLLANNLVLTYRYRVVAAVLKNTLWDRPKSAKLRWNKFSIFAKHWERNHEEYLAWKASNKGHSKVQKFDPVPEDAKIDPKEWNELAAWFKNHGKVGDWEFGKKDWELLGLSRGHVYITMLYCGQEGIASTKEAFINLLLEAAGVKAVGAAAGGGFDLEEA